MSYILGALKKAEKERARDKGIQIDNWSQDEWEEPEQRQKSYLGLISTAVIIILLLFLIVVFLAFQLGLTSGASEADSNELTADQPVNLSAKVLDERENLSTPLDSNEQQLMSSVDSFDSTRSNQSEVLALVSPASSENNTQDEPLGYEPVPSFTGHMYFPGNSALSRVFYDGRSYKEGELIGKYRVERIEELRVFLALTDGDEEKIGELLEVSLGQ